MNRDWEHVDQLAKKIWDYGRMDYEVEPADAITVFGSYNPLIAKRAVELYLQNYAPLVVFTGGRSDSTLSWEKTEAETFAELAISLGLPKEVILLETAAQNTGENVRFTHELLERHGVAPRKIIAIQKPYAERRMYATIRQQWPEVEVIPASPLVSYEEYMATSPQSKKHSISVMLGDLIRIKIYPEKGFQIPQEIPIEVWKAYEELSSLGLAESLPDADKVEN